MRVNSKVKVGDLLKIPVTMNLYAIGQVVAQPEFGFEYIIIFDKFIVDKEQLSSIDFSKNDIVLFAQVADGININPKIPKWTVLENIPVNEGLVFPEYKVLVRREWMVTNWEGKIIRKASNNEISDLHFQESFSCAAIVGAIRAYLGLEKPFSYYKRIIFKDPKI